MSTNSCGARASCSLEAPSRTHSEAAFAILRRYAEGSDGPFRRRLPTRPRQGNGAAMRAILRRLLPYALGLQRDKTTGHLYYPVEGVRHYVRFPQDTIRERWRREAFERIYFRHFVPTGNDCVVDIGAGLGTEIISLARRSPGLRYVAVEIQPWVYECLCLTLAQLPVGFRPFGLAIGDGQRVEIAPARVGIDATTLGGGPVPVETVTWGDFVRRHAIERVALLKVNVEGAEAELLERIHLDEVDRVVIGTHDFRADRGEGESFRTRARVEQQLRSGGFKLQSLDWGWIYGDRSS